MARQLYFEDVDVGMEIPPLAKVATTQMLVKWAGATGDFNPLHYDKDFAGKMKLGTPIVHGALKRAWLVQMLTQWIGLDGFIKRLTCEYRRMDYPRSMKTTTEPEEGATCWCKGLVTKKYVEGNEHIIECDIWVENDKGEKTTLGTATISLPSKGAC